MARLTKPIIHILWIIGALVSVSIVIVFALHHAGPLSRCGPGLEAIGPRCCGKGQTLNEEGACQGQPLSCGFGYTLSVEGCTPLAERIRFEGGTVHIGPSDWEAQGVVKAHDIIVHPFMLDRFEISIGYYRECVLQKRCKGFIPIGDVGRAAVLSVVQAEMFCRQQGGRLPKDNEWVWAAMGKNARRYPWGDAGAVCQRAAFGLVTGPCERGAKGPDTVGAHPAGRSAEGVDDLAGNVAEWTVDDTGNYHWRGGSYRSRLATELRGWRMETPANEGTDAVGARCAYDLF